MAAIARSDLYDGLVRKIGYSVGLEFLVPRVQDVLNVFRLGTLDGAAWRDLVRLRWQRASPTAEQNIADVYAQLDLLRRRNNSIHPLPALEIMAVLAAGANPITRESCAVARAVQFVLLLKILEADGDIFLNALASDFEAKSLGDRLTAMIRHKRRAVAPHFPQAGSIKRLAEAISIRNQSSEAKGAGARKTTYAERSRLLMSSTAPDVSKPWTEREVAISLDYMEKACVTRRGWAIELGLYDRVEGVTQAGSLLLTELQGLGLGCKDNGLGFFAFWPYPYQLARLGLTAPDLGAPSIHAGQIVATVAASIARPRCMPHQGDASREETLALLANALQHYRGTGLRGILRHELPLYVAEPVLAWWHADAGRQPQDLRAFVRKELQRSDRGIDEVTIRGTEGGLRLMEMRDNGSVQ